MVGRSEIDGLMVGRDGGVEVVGLFVVALDAAGIGAGQSGQPGGASVVVGRSQVDRPTVRGDGAVEVVRVRGGVPAPSLPEPVTEVHVGYGGVRQIGLGAE